MKVLTIPEEYASHSTGQAEIQLSILRINPPKFGGGLNFKHDTEIVQKVVFSKVSKSITRKTIDIGRKTWGQQKEDNIQELTHSI